MKSSEIWWQHTRRKILVDIAITIGFWILAIALLMFLAVSIVQVAVAQPHPPCGKLADITDRLKIEFHEVPTAMGLAKNGTVIQIYVSDETGTWTAVRITPRGDGCIIDVGTNWEFAPAGART